MTQLRVFLASVLGTIALFVLALWLNEHLFSHSEFVHGINWVYLPAGIRLLSTLLLAEAGAVGLLLVSWGVNFAYFFPHDPDRAIVGGFISSAVPYLIYKAAQYRYGLHASLSNLTSARLFVLILAYSILDPLALHIWLAWKGQTYLLFHGFIAMASGNLTGTMLVIYTLKVGLAVASRLLPRPATPPKAPHSIRQ